MLTKLLADAEALVAALPPMQTAIDAVTADIGGGGKIDPKQLGIDAAALSDSVGSVETGIEALQADLTALPQATSPEAMKEFGHTLQVLSTEASTLTNTRLQTLICIGLPLYNTFAAMNGWPVIPIPAFCGAAKGGE